MGLFSRKPEWEHEDWEKRLKAVEKLIAKADPANQKILYKLGTTDPVMKVRNAAMDGFMKIEISSGAVNDPNRWKRV